MNYKRPWYKRWQTWLGIIIVLGLLGKILPEPPRETSEANDIDRELSKPDKIAPETNHKTDDNETNEESSPITTSSVKSNLDKPLTKVEVLEKFEIDAEIKPYINEKFIFVGGHTDTADYYALADNDMYRNASVIFKDGQIARVKMIPSENQNVEKLFKEFGITEKPRKLRGYADAYEVALIPMFWSQNIERYPFELD